MKIQLPEEFEYHEASIHAYVEDGILRITPFGFEEIMYSLTYEVKGSETCCYCGRELTETNRTLDHIYPRDFGGISIPNNLEPCCKKCNKEKNNFFSWQYEKLRTIIDKAERRNQEELMHRQNYEKRKKMGIILPQDWYELREDYTVFTAITSEQKFKKSHKYQSLQEKFEIYGKICKPIVISRDRFVLDGFAAILLAKNLGMKRPLPFVMLENVSVV